MVRLVYMFIDGCFRFVLSSKKITSEKRVSGDFDQLFDDYVQGARNR